MRKMRPGGSGDWNEPYGEWTSRVWRKVLKGVALFLIVTAGVTCGNLASNYISVYFSGLMAERAAEEMKKLSEEQARLYAEDDRARQDRLERARVEEAKQAEVRRRQIEKHQKIQEQRRSTCMYWIDQYRQTGKELDRLHRNKSCRDAGVSVN